MIQKFLLLIIVATLTSTDARRRNGRTTAGGRGSSSYSRSSSSYSSSSSSSSKSGGDVTKSSSNGVLTIDRDDGKSGSKVKETNIIANAVNQNKTFNSGETVILYDLYDPNNDIYNGSGAAEVNSTDDVRYIETTIPDDITETVTYTKNPDGSMTKVIITMYNSTSNSTTTTTRYLTNKEAYAAVDIGENSTQVVD